MVGDNSRSKKENTGVDVVDKYSSWIISIARHVYINFYIDGADFEDYVQYGTLGLLEALNRFDPSIGSKFNSYAYMRVKGSILNNIYKFNEYTSTNKSKLDYVNERVDSLLNESEDCASKVDRLSNVIVELAVGFSLEELIQEGEENKFPCPYTKLYNTQFSKNLRNLVVDLPKKESDVVILHYFHQLSFIQIATLLDLSKGRIAQLHKSALKSLSERIVNNEELLC